MPQRTAKADPNGGTYVGASIDTPVHRAIKAAAKINGRTLAREINHRLRLSLEAEKAAKRGANVGSGEMTIT